MKTWTDAAKDRLEDYLAERARRAGLRGVERTEVVEDWRLHVFEELERGDGEEVSVATLEPVLERLGQGGAPETAPEVTPPASVPAGTVPAVPRRYWLWILGVILPAGIVLFEWATSFCGSVFFDPIRTWWHGLLLLLVPGVNAWVLVEMRRGALSRPRLAAAAMGVVTVVAGFYAWLFLPLLHLSILATVFMGLGLLSLMPIFTWIVSLRIGGHAKRSMEQPAVWRRNWRLGAGLGLLALLGLELGPFVTRVGLMRAMSDDAEKAESGVAMLRTYHSESTLLRACYEGNRGTTMATDLSGWLVKGWSIPGMMLGFNIIGQTNSNEAREIFYRVTGKPFNTMKPPRWTRGGGFLAGESGRRMEDFEFDDHLGGEQVAVRVKGLTMTESRLDANLDGESGLGYAEWTTVFRNVSSLAREARFQVQLPPGGVASRVTLWINGEPREAAFASKAKVRKAYQEVAVVQRRDPVLVTASGPERILVQCFPIPANGGEMKIRVGVTAPLDKGVMRFPRILERNFALDSRLEHTVWLQSQREFGVMGAGKVEAAVDGTGFSAQLAVGPGELDQVTAELRAVHPEEEVYCRDPFASDADRFLTMQRGRRAVGAADRCVVVLDGSRGLAPWRRELGEVLAKFADRENLTILVADDEASEVAPGDVSRVKFAGGRDNVPALVEAVRRTRAAENGAVVWIHAAQPISSPKIQMLEQLYSRGVTQVPLYSIPLAAGGNRVLEELFRYRAVQAGPAVSDLDADLVPFLEGFLGGREEETFAWTRSEIAPRELPEVSDQLARWWAATQVRDAYRAQSADRARIDFAAKYQLVTAFSGAVVLETQEQYDRHGLKPVDVNSAAAIPAVPEPGVWMLMALAAMAGMWRRRRPGARA